MIVYPAIDLRGGKVVRLQEGDPDLQKTFSHDPIATAQDWLEQGAKWIHMVNLDGAFSDANDNGRILVEAAQLDGVRIQFGGGLRSMADIERVISNGAKRVVLGTIAVKEPNIVQKAVEQFGPDAICVALDARDGKIATHGWQQATHFTPVEFGREMVERGVVHALYTDVQRDGKLSGVDVEGTVRLSVQTGLQVIASGGVSSLTEIETLHQSKQVAGVVIGMALYEKRFALAQAIAAAEGDHAG